MDKYNKDPPHPHHTTPFKEFRARILNLHKLMDYKNNIILRNLPLPSAPSQPSCSRRGKEVQCLVL